MLALLLTVAGADTGTMEIAAAMASAGMADGSNLADLTCVEQSWPPPQISGLYAFSGAEAGSSIEDGGNDMYDGGNMMWLRVNGQWSPHALKYTQVCFGGDMGEGEVFRGRRPARGSSPSARSASSTRSEPAAGGSLLA